MSLLYKLDWSITEMEKLLSDLVDYQGDPEILLDWDNFTNPVRNILKRLCFERLEPEYTEAVILGCCYEFLKHITYYDLLDMRHVGEIRKDQVIKELINVFSVFEKQGHDGWVVPVFEEVNEEEFYNPDAVDLALTLEDLVKGILIQFDDYRAIDDRTIAILRGRIPAFLREPQSLEELGNRFGVTRERVRQIEGKFKDLQLGTLKNHNSCLQFLIDILEKADSEDEFCKLAQEADLLGEEPISVEKLKDLIRILGLDDYLDRVEAKEDEWDTKNQELNNLSALAKKARHKFGLIDLNTFTADTKTNKADAFAAIKDAYPRSIKIGDLVLARTVSLDSGFENALGKQLKVFGSLPAENLLVGIERQAQYRQTPLIGQASDQIGLIHLLAGEKPDFETYKKNTLEEPELSDTDQWFIDTLRSAPTGMMHRNELTAAALRDNKNVNSIGIFILFNSLIRNLGYAVVALADTEIPPEDVKNYAEIMRASEEPTQLDFEFSGSDILIRFTPNLNTIAAGVLFPKQELRDLIKNIAFDVVCACGAFESNQQLRLKDPSFWTGFTAAIKHLRNHHGWHERSEVSMRLNFDAKTAEILL